MKLADFDVPNAIQPGEYSMGGVTDGFMHENTISASRGERELGWRRLGCQCELRRESEQVE